MSHAVDDKSSSYENFMRRIRKVHFVGIGGAGMSGIADVMNTLGYQVSGSDIASNAVTERLQSLGVKVYHTHTAENIRDVDVVVTSTAIDKNNLEVETATTVPPAPPHAPAKSAEVKAIVRINCEKSI